MYISYKMSKVYVLKDIDILALKFIERIVSEYPE